VTNLGKTPPDREGLRKELVQVLGTGASSSVLRNQGLPIISGLDYVSKIIDLETQGDLSLALRIALEEAIHALGNGSTHDAALTLFGLTPETRTLNLTERRAAAARHMRIASADSFRKGGEDRIVREVVEEIYKAEVKYLTSKITEQDRHFGPVTLKRREGAPTVKLQGDPKWQARSGSPPSEIYYARRQARKDIVNNVLPQLIQWFLFSVLIVLLPIGIAITGAHTRNAHLDITGIISDGELLLGAAAITAAAAGEMVGSALTSKPRNGSPVGGSMRVLLLWVSIVLVVLATAWFGQISDATHSGGTLNTNFVTEGSFVLLFVAMVTGFFCVIAAAMDQKQDWGYPVPPPSIRPLEARIVD